MPDSGAIALLDTGPDGLTRRQQDFMLLMAHVMATQGRLDEAATMIDAVLRLKGPGEDALFAAAVLDFARGHVRHCRDRLAEIRRVEGTRTRRRGARTARQRARLYLEARCAYELGLSEEADAALSAYMAAAPAVELD
ncbi:MAG: hypothetical protein AAGF48_15385 [Pseudomonadota bacterium]